MEPRFRPAQAAIKSDDLSTLASLIEADPTLASSPSLEKCDHPSLLQCLVLEEPAGDNLELMIDVLVAHGSELDGPFVAAAGIGNIRALSRLLDHGASVNGKGHWSPLEEAVYWVQTQAVEFLLSRGAKIGNLRTAAALGDLSYMQTCFDAEGNIIPAAAGEIDWPFGPLPDPGSRNDSRQVLANALVHAASWGRVDSVKYLIHQGADINLIPAGFDFAGTALHYAAHRNQEAVVDLLLDRGALTNLRDTKVNQFPEGWAEHGGHLALAERLRAIRLASSHSEPI